MAPATQMASLRRASLIERARAAAGSAGPWLAMLAVLIGIGGRTWVAGSRQLTDIAACTIGTLAWAMTTAAPLGKRSNPLQELTLASLVVLTAFAALKTALDARLMGYVSEHPIPIAMTFVLVCTAARALVFGRPIARARVVLTCAAMVLGLGASEAIASGIANQTNCDAWSPPPSFVAREIGDAELARFWTSLVAAISFAALDARESSRARLLFRTLALAAAAVAIEAGVTWLVTAVGVASRSSGLPVRPSMLGGLAGMLDVWDVVTGCCVGMALALTLAATLGAGGRSLRTLVRASLPALVVATSLLAFPTGVTHVFAWVQWVTPVWIDAGVRPPVLEGDDRPNRAVPLDASEGETWVLDATGAVVRRYGDVARTAEPRHYARDDQGPTLEIVPDESLDLRTVVRTAASLPSVWQVVIVGRDRAARALDDRPDAVNRFTAADAWARDVRTHRVVMIREDEIERRRAELFDGACLAPPPWEPAGDPECAATDARVVVIHELPPGLPIAALDGLSARSVWVVRPLDLPLLAVPAPQPMPARAVREGRSPFVLAVGLGALLCLSSMLVLAWSRWRRRGSLAPTPRAGTATPITPAWLAARACDMEVAVSETQPTYRAQGVKHARTARSFWRGLRITVVEAMVDARVWIAVVLAIVLAALSAIPPG